ncbi:MAG: pyridoxamine 5'-phosphate oxidase family protein [Panacagrimonas sp.]
MDDSRSPEDSLIKLKELIDDIKIALLVTMDSDGALRGRPMATQELDSDAELWFFTNDYSSKVESVIVHPEVCVSYAAPEKSRYVSVSGKAELVRDPDKIRQLWKPELKAWFAGGIDDPDLALLRVDIVSAQFWDAPSSKLVQLFGLVKAMATGESTTKNRVKNLGENEKLTVRERIGSDTAT